MKKITSISPFIGILFYIFSIQHASARPLLGYAIGGPSFEELISMILIITIGLIILTKLFKKLFGKSDKLNIHGLVLSKYIAKSEGKPELSIQARKGGIWNFIMIKAKIDNKVSISLDDTGKNLVCEVYNLNGYNRTIINLDDISSFSFEYKRNLIFTVILGVILFFMLFVEAWVGVVGGIILTAWFFLSKSFILELETVSGTRLSFGFSTSVIEHIHMDRVKGEEIQNILIHLKN